MPDFGFIEFYAHSPIRNVVEVWNADGHHVSVRCNDGSVYTVLQDEISRTLIPPGWKMEAEFPYCASMS